jgi:hypothetical protein
MLADRTFVEVFSDGTLQKHHAADARTDKFQLATSAPLPADEIDISDHEVAFLDGQRVSVVDLEGDVVADAPVTGRSCSDPTFATETSYVDLAEDASAVAVVTCGDGDQRTLEVGPIDGEGVGLRRFDIRYQGAGTVAVANGGEIAVVATGIGQVGILRDGKWIEPGALRADRYAHNDYQVGWAAIDPAGRFVVTRLDGSGVELWAIDASPVARVAVLTEDELTQPPAFAQFDPDSGGVTVGWDSARGRGSSDNEVMSKSWSFLRTELTRAACGELSQGPPDYAIAAGVTEIPGCSKT